jgi:hypothetical protein
VRQLNNKPPAFDSWIRGIKEKIDFGFFNKSPKGNR